ncbi:MAG: response regulator transcription factor [Bacteroidales bacterium]|jgi:two-component system alkaline phosphatase synthesis response regulator PhoP|nr:response regulator transcription factor [Bacteroidales bacterium]
MNNLKQRILLVDDEEDILEFLSFTLEKDGFEIRTASLGKDAILIAKEFLPDLIILDVMMPDMDGIETCIELRKIEEIKNTMIVFLTARNEDYSLLAGFDAGADDYISKPIKPKILSSKIKALLRRHSNQGTISIKNENAISLNNIIIDKETYTVKVNNKEVYLSKKEFEILYLLVSKPNKVFSRDEIYSAVWEDGVFVGERTIDVHVRKLREKLKIDNIKTYKGVGYKYEE